MPATVSAAALVGTGLLYQGSAHSFMTEVLLSEMARIPVDDTNQVILLIYFLFIFCFSEMLMLAKDTL